MFAAPKPLLLHRLYRPLFQFSPRAHFLRVHAEGNRSPLPRDVEVHKLPGVVLHLAGVAADAQAPSANTYEEQGLVCEPRYPRSLQRAPPRSCPSRGLTAARAPRDTHPAPPPAPRSPGPAAPRGAEPPSRSYLACAAAERERGRAAEAETA